MNDSFDAGPPLLTEIIESGLQEIEASTQNDAQSASIDILKAQLPELFEKALLRVKPQLMAEFSKIVQEALRKQN